MKSTSASQVNAFRNCQRLWYYRSVLKDKQPKTPAQQRGTDIHDEIEHYLHTGTIRSNVNDYDRYVEWLKPHLPVPNTEPLAIEQRFTLQTPYGIPWTGYIDLGILARIPPVVADFKTTTNLRYAKTPAELRVDTQLNCYARKYFELEPSLEYVKVGHFYIKVAKKAPKRVRSQKILPVFTEISKSQCEETWQRDMLVVGQMIQAESAPDVKDLEPNLNHCSAYGGCQYLGRCGVSAMDKFKPKTKTTNGAEMGFLDQVRAKAGTPKNGATAKPSFAKKEAAPPAPEPKPEAASSASEAASEPAILPPDAPSRETTAEEAAEIQAKAAKKAAPKKKATRKAKHKRELTLYIDCVPTKGEHLAPVVAFEDWVRPVIAELNEQLDVADYRLLQFHEPKVALEGAVVTKIAEGEMPTAMVIDSRTAEAVAVAALIEKSTDVVRGLR